MTSAGIKRWPVALLIAGLALAGSATAAPPENPTRTTLTGRVVASARVVKVIREDRRIWAMAFRIEPIDAPGTVVTVISDSNCPRDDSRTYVLTIERQPLYLGFRGDMDDSMVSDWKIVACRPVAP